MFLDGTTWALESLKQRGIGSISRLSTHQLVLFHKIQESLYCRCLLFFLFLFSLFLPFFCSEEPVGGGAGRRPGTLRFVPDTRREKRETVT